MKLRTTGKAIKLAPIHPNVGVRAAYLRKLMNLVNGLHAALVNAATSVYSDLRPIQNDSMPDLSPKDNQVPQTSSSTIQYAFDYATQKQLTAAMSQAAREWKRTFVSEAKNIAKKFANNAMKSTDAAFKTGLRSAGISVKMQVTPVVEATLDDCIKENVKLIKSICDQHHEEVAKMVLESASKGRSMKELTTGLQTRYGVTKRRAALIARDQNNKATAMIHRAQQKQYGITQAAWIHSMASVHPREEHASWYAEGKTYSVSEGMWSEEDGEFVWPGTPINCGCIAQSIVPGMDEEGE